MRGAAVNEHRDESPARIKAVPYRAPGTTTSVRRLRPSALWISLGALGVFAVVSILFFVLARSVKIDVTPAAQSIDVDGGIGFALGSGYLLLPGQYQLSARADGYQDLKGEFTVGEAAQQSFKFELVRLPGKLSVSSEPAAEVFIDGNPRGTTPWESLELTPGAHRLMLRAARYQVHEAEVQIEGGGVAQSVRVQLKPGWAPVSISSIPAGAEILLDGQASGRTPQTLEVGSGAHELVLRLEAYATWRDSINVTANEPLNLPPVKLLPAEGVLKLSSTPSGASVTVGGSFRGQTPLDLRLAPGRSHLIQLSAPGHRPAERSIEMTAEQTDTLKVALEPILGTLTLDVQPADAQVKVDGRVIAPGTTTLELTATAHRIEASKSGFASYSGSATPRPGLEQRVEIRLKSEAESRAERTPTTVASKVGPKLVLIQPGSFTMGTPRGEQGRQSNEAQRAVKLTRAFYLATTEVTNAQYRRFAEKHSSGIIRKETLDNENQPAVRVSWVGATRYCNWLSQHDGLPAAYTDGGALLQPATTGYRLPSEAEWEWAARFAGRATPQRYPWGSGFPPPPKSGNFADKRAEGLTDSVLPDYDDGYAAASPVASFPASALGLFDLGGNVAEWTQDGYEAVLPIGSAEAVDPFGAPGSPDHVIRGSSWMHGRLVELRLAYRDFGRDSRPDVGFRVARYAE